MSAPKKIAIITSSRADFGIYQPLISAIESMSEFRLELIAIGSHFFSNQGETIQEVRHFYSGTIHEISVCSQGTSLKEISENFSKTYSGVEELWSKNADYDLVFALGDRYEMAAAVLSTVPYQIPVAHLHGGEITLGAIDQIYRDTITLSSKLHFTATEQAKKRVESILGPQLKNSCVLHSGSIVLDKIAALPELSETEFYQRFNFDLSQDFLLITIHPETVAMTENHLHVNEFEKAMDWIMEKTSYNLLITLPNADPGAEVWRRLFINKSSKQGRIYCYENLGVQAYYTAMKKCQSMLGNSSSGIIESASAGAWVINLGSRQEGREFNQNTRHVRFQFEDILDALNSLPSNRYEGENIYGNGNAVLKILNSTKKYLKIAD
jgi:GDP/UDP-N,N'-diacetylbacillosamine 2-epimerase (hydrolysing)